MKNLIKLIALLSVTIGLLFASCEKMEIEFSGTETFEIKNLTHSDCKNSNKKSSETESITLKTIDENELKITHNNVVFPCCPNGEFKAEAYRSNDTIFLNEYYTDNTCNCLCPYDLDYTIGPLEYGKYTVVLQLYNDDYFTFKFNFKSNTDITIKIKEK